MEEKQYRAVLRWVYWHGDPPKFESDMKGCWPYYRLPRTEFFSDGKEAFEAGKKLRKEMLRKYNLEADEKLREDGSEESYEDEIFSISLEDSKEGSWGDPNLEFAVRRKLPEWYKAYHGSPPNHKKFLEGEKCPMCEEERLYCCSADLGHVDRDLYFLHICTKPGCRFFERDCVGDDYISPDNCPICKGERCSPMDLESFMLMIEARRLRG